VSKLMQNQRICQSPCGLTETGLDLNSGSALQGRAVIGALHRLKKTTDMVTSSVEVRASLSKDAEVLVPITQGLDAMRK